MLCCNLFYFRRGLSPQIWNQKLFPKGFCHPVLHRLAPLLGRFHSIHPECFLWFLRLFPVRLTKEFSTFFLCKWLSTGCCSPRTPFDRHRKSATCSSETISRFLYERQTFKNEIDTVIFKGLIRPSISPLSSPVVLSWKRTNPSVFASTSGALIKIRKKDDLYPMPRIVHALYSLRGASHSYSFDLRSGNWQIPMAQEDKKTASIIPDGLFKFNVMLFGLSNAP